jgi:clan AA aspartic protease (TIGR02281 family)
MERLENGLYLIPCKVNGVPMKFIFDTGASTVNISMTEALFLLKNGHIQESDIKGTSHAQIANGEIVENTRILLHKIDIGGIEISDVDATVSHNLNAPLLLGQSAINKLGTIELEGTNLIIKNDKGVDNNINFYHLGLLLLIAGIICYLIYIVFSRFKEHHSPKSEDNERISSKRNILYGIGSKLAWLESRKYIVYIAYSFILLLSVIVIEVHIDNKRDMLSSDLWSQIRNAIVGPNGEDYIEALEHEHIDDLEYEEVPIPKFISESDNIKTNKRKKKQWDNMFSGIEHIYKITDGGWTMSGMSCQPVRYKDEYYRDGIQDFRYFPYMICVPNGVEFNTEIAKHILKESLDKVYCEPNRYNAFADIEKENEYFNFIGRIWNDSLPKPSIHFYNETTGTDPIFEDGKFTGFYWFGMHRIGPFRVLLGYQDITVWGVVEKEGFNASTKDRVIYYGLVFIILTSLLCFFLYSTKRKHNRA